MMRILKLLSSILLFTFLGSISAQAGPVVEFGVTGGEVIDSGSTDFEPGTPSGSEFVFEEITPINADPTQPFFINRATNIFWNVLPIDNSNPINLNAPTSIVWIGAPNINTTFGAWIEDYVQNYGVQGFQYSNKATYRALGLNSPAGLNFFTDPCSVDLSFGGKTYRALVIGVNTVLLQFETDPPPIILPEFSFDNSDDKDSRIRISRESDKLICTAGKYRYGIPSKWSEAPMKTVSYSLYLDGKLISSQVTDGNVHVFDVSLLGGSKGLATCSLTLSDGLSSLKDNSDWNSNLLRKAQSDKSSSVSKSILENSIMTKSKLLELEVRRDTIRQNYKLERERKNLEYWRLNTQTKIDFKAGVITSREYTSRVRQINMDILKEIKDLRLQEKKDLEINSLANMTIVHEMESALRDAFGNADYLYALTLEEAGYSITIK